MPKFNEPLSGVVDTGMTATLAQNLGMKLKRKVVVTRDRFYYKRHGKTVLSPWKYSILFEGVNIPFSGLTVVEAKGRLAMLLDLYYSGVFNGPDIDPLADAARAIEDRIRRSAENDEKRVTGAPPGGDADGNVASGDGDRDTRPY